MRCYKPHRCSGENCQNFTHRLENVERLASFNMFVGIAAFLVDSGTIELITAVAVALTIMG